MKSYIKHVCSLLQWSYNVYIMYLSSVNVSYEDSDKKAQMAGHTSAFTGCVYNKYQMLLCNRSFFSFFSAFTDLLKDLRAGHLITIFSNQPVGRRQIMNEGDIM